ncbi:zinc ribbon domain-containing protein [Photorhabdus caribbeanensis]|uniref:zinc ribbon domain-containing protein n=1 Tax=Photorhabdus caribbeanensis TaxID=1004165 RepID=UPI001BD53675|nr:hypothetical protein [Photorhabdus caribbeanensis]
MDMQKGVYIVRFEQWYASLKTCRCCGDKIPKIPLKVRFWHCPEYGLEHDRDINATLNIKQQGIATKGLLASM